MNEQQLKEAFMQYLMEKSGAQTEQEFEAYVQQLGEEGIRQEYAQFMQMIQQQQVASRKFGGMLNYIGKLRGICPEGQEMQFFKKGGQVCKKCVQKIKMQDGGTTPQNAVEEFKCGRKMKRKAACGTKLPKDKCGNKVEMDKCGKKMKKGENGLKTSFTYKGATPVKPFGKGSEMHESIQFPNGDMLHLLTNKRDSALKYSPLTGQGGIVTNNSTSKLWPFAKKTWEYLKNQSSK